MLPTTRQTYYKYRENMGGKCVIMAITDCKKMLELMSFSLENYEIFLILNVQKNH